MNTHIKGTRKLRLNRITNFIIKAHEKSGQAAMSEHVQKMHSAVQKAVCSDPRFCTPKDNNSYKPMPYVVDITTPDEKGQHHAIINNAKGELVRHGFDFDKDLGTAKMVEGDSKPTESTRIYASSIERHENMIQASQEFLSCRASAGSKLDTSEKWEAGKSVSYIFVPGGISTISAGFRAKESITCTVEVDEQTAKDLQESFDYIAATEKQEPYADEDHEAKKATLRFPSDKVKFVYGTLRGEDGIIVQGAEPTSYGAESVNGKVYRSWSPEFATDANYAKAKCKKNHWTFPDGVRGSASNPASIIAVNFVTGALTNKPAFKNMPPVKAKKVEIQVDETNRLFEKLFISDEDRKSFVAEHPSIEWLPAAVGLEENQNTKFVVAAHEADTQTLSDLQSRVCKAAEQDSRFKDDGTSKGDCIKCVWCCDIVLDKDEDSWKAVISCAGSKLWEVPFTISEDDGSITLGTETKEVARKTEYVSACDKSEFLLNGEVITATGTSEGNKKGWEGRHSGKPTAKRIMWHGGKNSIGHISEFQHGNDKNMPRIGSALYTALKKDGKEIAWSERRPLHADRAERMGLLTPHDAEHDQKPFHYESFEEFKMEGEKTKAKEKNLSPLDLIYARHEQERRAADSIAMKSPEIAAREAEKNKPKDSSLDSIFARADGQRKFEESLIARSPVLANREALEAIANRK